VEPLPVAPPSEVPEVVPDVFVELLRVGFFLAGFVGLLAFPTISLVTPNWKTVFSATFAWFE
jgi:hypothetical protein